MNPTRTLQEILDALYRNFGLNRLTGRPYNRFRSEQTLWWLVPTAMYPIYKYCKFFLEQTSNPSIVDVGLFVEKGIGYPSSERNRSMYLDLDWYWSKLVMNNAKKLQEIISKIAESSKAYSTYVELSCPALEAKHVQSLSDAELEYYKNSPKLVVNFQAGVISSVELLNMEKATPTVFHLLRRYAAVPDTATLANLFIEISQPNTDYAAQWAEAKFGARVQSNYLVEAFLEDFSEYVFEDAPQSAQHLAHNL